MRFSVFRRLRRHAATLALLGCAAGAAAGATQCTYSQLATIPLSYSGAGLAVTLTGEIDGTPARMAVDTGAFASFLTRTGTERRGLRLRYFDNKVSGVGGSSRVYTVDLKDLAIGPVHTGEHRMPVLGQTGFVPPFDAIVGIDFLNQVDLEISLMDKTLKMFKASGCDDSFLGYWDSNNTIEVPFVTTRRHTSRPRIPVKVNGKELEAIIDSGAGFSSIRLDAARRVGFKLDAPGVSRMGTAVGVGERRVSRWSAVFDSLSIGGERIAKPRLFVLDKRERSDVDLVLGTDFLRAHHVLFAMSQRKVYLSYVGGDIFSQRDRIEPWMRKEADAGNPDAQYAVARMYLNGEGAAKDEAKGNAWLDKALAQGSPDANLFVGERLMKQARYADAAQRFKTALDRWPTERRAALMLYLARLQGGDAEAAKRELEASFAPGKGAWPTPIANFYLGRIDADALLKEAADDDDLAGARVCEAKTYLAWWQEVHGDKARAEALRASVKEQCAYKAGKPKTRTEGS